MIQEEAEMIRFELLRLTSQTPVTLGTPPVLTMTLATLRTVVSPFAQVVVSLVLQLQQAFISRTVALRIHKSTAQMVVVMLTLGLCPPSPSLLRLLQTR